MSIWTPAVTKEVDLKLYSTTVPANFAMMYNPPKLSFDPEKPQTILKQRDFSIF
jgi:hypothetical protein